MEHFKNKIINNKIKTEARNERKLISVKRDIEGLVSGQEKNCIWGMKRDSSLRFSSVETSYTDKIYIEMPVITFPSKLS